MSDDPGQFNIDQSVKQTITIKKPGWTVLWLFLLIVIISLLLLVSGPILETKTPAESPSPSATRDRRGTVTAIFEEGTRHAEATLSASPPVSDSYYRALTATAMIAHATALVEDATAHTRATYQSLLTRTLSPPERSAIAVIEAATRQAQQSQATMSAPPPARNFYLLMTATSMIEWATVQAQTTSDSWLTGTLSPQELTTIALTEATTLQARETLRAQLPTTAFYLGLTATVMVEEAATNVHGWSTLAAEAILTQTAHPSGMTETAAAQ